MKRKFSNAELNLDNDYQIFPNLFSRLKHQIKKVIVIKTDINIDTCITVNNNNNSYTFFKIVEVLLKKYLRKCAEYILKEEIEYTSHNRKIHNIAFLYQIKIIKAIT